MRIYKGNIISCDDSNSVFQYLVENKGKIEFLGNDLPEKYKDAAVEDIGGKALLPSFADTHLHFSSYALFASTLDIRAASNFSEIGEMLNDYINLQNPDFILAFGSSAHNVKERCLISKKELDKFCPDKPVMIIKYDGHASIINTKMLQLLPQEIHKLRGFNLDSGRLFHETFFAATDYMTNKISPIKLVKNMLKGIDLLAEKGIGMMHTVEGVGFPRDLDVDLARFVAKGQKNPFQSRIFFQTMDVNKVLKRKLPRIGGCFETALDGCFGSVDAALIDPYSNNNKNRGVLFYSREEVNEFAKKSNRAGLQIEMHAIGDAAFEQAVNAIEHALLDFPREDHRHTVIHACLPTEAGLEKLAKLGIGIAAQPAFLHWNLEPLEYLENVLGERAFQLSPFRKMMDMGIHVSGGSDAPCTLPDPINGIHCACNHYIPEQSISIAEALRMFTYEAARMSFDEKERGSLEVNKFADMIILDKNPLKMQPKDLKNLRVEKLLLQGKRYKPGQKLSGLLLRGLFGRKSKI